MDGQRYNIRAGVTSIGGYSVHADQKDLLNFVKCMHHWPRHIRIVHGDPGARQALRDLYQSLASDAGHKLEVVLPGNG